MSEFRRKLLIAQSSSITPQTYTTLTYIEGTGTQYIATGITLASGMEIVSKFYAASPTSSTGGSGGSDINWLWSSTTNAAATILQYRTTVQGRLQIHNGVYARYVNLSGLPSGRYLKVKTSIDGGTSAASTRFGYIYGTSNTVFTSTSYTAATSGAWPIESAFGNILIGGVYSSGAGGIITSPEFKFYGMEITENNITTHNLIPAMRDSDGAVGVLDQTTNVFYLNSGTGSFSYA